MGTEETKEQQQMYNIFRSCIYIFLIIELVMNLPITSESRATQFVLELIGRFQIFNSVSSCKFIELVCIAVTCIGTRAKVSLRFNVKTMVIYPIVIFTDYPLYRVTAWPVGRRAWRFCHQPRTLCPVKHRWNHVGASGG